MRQDRGLEPLQLGSGFDADPLHERAARLPVGVQRLGLSLRAVQRQHPLGVQPLAQRMLHDQRLELPDHIGVAARRQVRLDRQLVCVHAQLVEPADLGGGERLAGDVGERLAAPELERVARPRLVHQSLEARDVDRVRGQPELVVAAVGDDRRAVAVEQPSQLRDVELHHLRSAGRRLVAPQPFGQAIGRHRPVGLEAEHREDCALLASTEDEDAGAEASLDRPEELEIHSVWRPGCARAYSRRIGE